MKCRKSLRSNVPILLAVGACVLLLSTSALAQEQPRCGPSEGIRKILAEKYHEVPTWAGVDATGNAIALIYQSPSGTWTEVLVRPNGVSCLVGSGDHARLIKPTKAGAKAGSDE